MNKITKKILSYVMVISFVVTLCFEWGYTKAEAANEIRNIRLYGQRAACHCAEASLACVEAYRLGLNEQDNPAIYWACWAVTTGGALMPGDGFRNVDKNAAAICREIDAGNPVLLYFSNFGSQGNYHWVVAYGYEGNGNDFGKIKIMCPAHNGSTPTAWFTTLANERCTVSNLCNAKVVAGGFIQSVSGNTVVADGVFTNVKVTDCSANDAAIQCTLRYTSDGGHDCDDFGFYISTNPDMSGATMHRESDLNAGNRNRNGVYADVKIPYYKMSKWHKSYRSSTKHYFQFFIEKNGILIKSKVYPLESGSPKAIEGDVTAPVVSSARIASVNDDHYTVLVQASDNVGVTRVAFPSWTAYNDQDDLAKDWWINSGINTSKATNGYYSMNIYFSDHNNETGTYYTHVYAYDAAGNYVCGANLQIPRYTLKQKKISLTKGDTKSLAFSPALGSGVTVEYQSSNTKVATVSSKGVITAKGKGSCTITAKLVLPQDNSIDYRLTASVEVKENTVNTNTGTGNCTNITLDSNTNTGANTNINTTTNTNNTNVNTSVNTNTDNNTDATTITVTDTFDTNNSAEIVKTEEASPMIIWGKDLSWNEVGGKAYWYENGYKQGTYDDPKGVMGDGTVRGREICDNSVKDSNGNGTWYWLDAAYGGAKATNKEVWMPYIYKNEDTLSYSQKSDAAARSDGGMNGLGSCVLNAMNSKTGKWVRYDGEGRMMKGWVTIRDELASYYPNQVGNTYYYDSVTGLMAKGWVIIDGQTYHFDEVSGVLR